MDNVKQIIVMRTDLGMRKGKMIAQGAHASMKFITDRLILSLDDYRGTYVTSGDNFSSTEGKWMESGFTKICVRVDSEEELLEIYQAALEEGLVAKLIKDSGKTEFNGIPTLTCCAIGPDISALIDPITGHLKLL